MHEAMRGVIVADGIVLGRTVVPNCHGIPLPAQPRLKFGALEIAEEQRQKRVALNPLQPEDAIGVTGCVRMTG